MTEKEKAKAYDKKIREAILNGLIDCRDAPDLGWSNFGGIHIDDCIDWLEKQGEQASSQTNERAWLYLISDVLTWKDGIGQYLDDPRVQKLAKRLCSEYAQKLYNPSNTGKMDKSLYKIETRFKVGDWVVNKFGDSYHIDSLDKKNYQISDRKGNYNYFPISKQDEMHLWTIQDVRDGDVIFYDEGWICIFKCIHGIWYSSYCFITDNGEFHTGYERHAVDSTIHGNAHPATKEQRDLLFQKIKEAGYEWDADKKELKKLVEPKFKVGDKIVNVPMKYWGAPVTQGTISKITGDKYIFTDGSRMSISNQDSWELVSGKKPKFDPKTLKPFDKVLCKNGLDMWCCDLFSSYVETYACPNVCISGSYIYCIPYNDDTKHLVGTNEKAPEYYRYWED